MPQAYELVLMYTAFISGVLRSCVYSSVCLFVHFDFVNHVFCLPVPLILILTYLDTSKFVL